MQQSLDGGYTTRGLTDLHHLEIAVVRANSDSSHSRHPSHQVSSRTTSPEQFRSGHMSGRTKLEVIVVSTTCLQLSQTEAPFLRANTPRVSATAFLTRTSRCERRLRAKLCTLDMYSASSTTGITTCTQNNVICCSLHT